MPFRPLISWVSSTRLKNIEETEKAKRQMSELRKERSKRGDDEAHLAAARCMYFSSLSQILNLRAATLTTPTVFSLSPQS